jgi:hypothetical protein
VASHTETRARACDGGTVTGFIETNGTIGALDVANVKDWTTGLSAPDLKAGPRKSSRSITDLRVSAARRSQPMRPIRSPISWMGWPVTHLSGQLLGAQLLLPGQRFAELPERPDVKGAVFPGTSDAPAALALRASPAVFAVAAPVPPSVRDGCSSPG